MEHNNIHFHWNYLIAFTCSPPGLAGPFCIGTGHLPGRTAVSKHQPYWGVAGPWPLTLGLAALIFDLTKLFSVLVAFPDRRIYLADVRWQLAVDRFLDLVVCLFYLVDSSSLA
jgi:hypothetical protein